MKIGIVDSAIAIRGMSQEAKEKAIIDYIMKKRPKVLCFSSTHKEFSEVVRMNNAIHRFDEGVITIVGGPQATYRPADFLDNGFAYLGMTEGEKTLVEFVKEVFAKTYQWNNVKGLCWKDGPNIITNPQRPLMTEKELDDIPILPYHKIDRRYFDIDIRMIKGIAAAGSIAHDDSWMSLLVLLLRMQPNLWKEITFIFNGPHRARN